MVAASPMPSPTARIAARVCEVAYETLDDKAIAAVKLFISDGIAVAMAGTVEEALLA